MTSWPHATAQPSGFSVCNSQAHAPAMLRAPFAGGVGGGTGCVGPASAAAPGTGAGALSSGCRM